MRIKKTSNTRALAGKVLNVNNNSSTDAYSCDYINGTTLYESSGTVGNVTLSDSISNYKRLKIFAYRGGLNISFITEHDTSKNINEFINVFYNSDLSKTQIAYEQISISGTTITRGTARYVNLPDGEGTSSGGLFTIYKVVGYKY